MKGRRNPERQRLEPVVVKNVKAGDSLLEEYVVTLDVYMLDNSHFMIREIFGPILPIIAVDGLNEAIEFINER